MRILESKTERVAIDALRPHPRNPREGDIGAIHQSIENNGFYGSVIAQKSTGFILAGNHRWQAAQQQGATEIPVTWIDVDDDHALRILLADNRTNDLASYNDNELAELLQSLRDETGTLAGTGYDGDDLDELLDDLGLAHDAGTGDAPEAQTDRADELREKWGTEVGQLWRIGPHRLLCGDSTKQADRERLFAGRSPAMLWSDPPYGLGGYKGRGGSLTAVEGDDAGPDTLRAFFSVGDAPEAYVCCEFKTYKHLEAARGTPRSLIVWGKNVFGMGRGYRRQHEFIGYYGGFSGTTESDLWLEARDSDYMHPTQKPPSLAARAIKNSTERGDIVDCPYAGSGDAFLGAHQTKRVCFGMEYAPKYVAVILERLSDAGLTPDLVE